MPHRGLLVLFFGVHSCREHRCCDPSDVARNVHKLLRGRGARGFRSHIVNSNSRLDTAFVDHIWVGWVSSAKPLGQICLLSFRLFCNVEFCVRSGCYGDERGLVLPFGDVKGFFHSPICHLWSDRGVVEPVADDPIGTSRPSAQYRSGRNRNQFTRAGFALKVARKSMARVQFALKMGFLVRRRFESNL